MTLASHHTTYPADIFQTACGVVMEAKSLKSMLRHKDVVDAIAVALLAERQARDRETPSEFERLCQCKP